MEISEYSRVWIYQADRFLSTDEESKIQSALNDFTSQWLAHGNKLTAAGEIRYNRFIILSVDENQTGATGCSIDKSVNLMKEIEQQFNLNLFNRFQIAYRDGENIRSCDRDSFEKRLQSGEVNTNTIVFNNMIATRKELGTNWEIPIKNSWHAQVFNNSIQA